MIIVGTNFCGATWTHLGNAIRYTHNGWSVEVQRYQLTAEEYKIIEQEEKDHKIIYPEAILLVSGKDYQFARNCHDYAFAPFMSCLCSTAGPQKEAWWMEPKTYPVQSVSVNRNWLDTSMEEVVTSYRGVIDPGDEYLFTTADLQDLPSRYQDNLEFKYLPLPACPVEDPASFMPPAHSAILVSWFDVGGGYSAGLYKSKWGIDGIYLHRWGEGYCPPIYYQSSQLRVFAPKAPWSSPFGIFHTPWGL